MYNNDSYVQIGYIWSRVYSYNNTLEKSYTIYYTDSMTSKAKLLSSSIIEWKSANNTILLQRLNTNCDP